MHFTCHALFFGIILVLSATISNSSFLNPTMAHAEENQTCPANQFSAFGHCYAIGTSPFKQMTNGISSHNVICKNGFVLIEKSSNNFIACVKPSTAHKLVERGWRTTQISATGENQSKQSTRPSTFNLLHNKEKNGTLSGDIVLVGGPATLVGPKIHYEVDVYATDGVMIVAKILSNTHAHYSTQLPAGNYIIYAPDYPTKQTHLVSVFSGKKTILNIVYGIGYK